MPYRDRLNRLKSAFKMAGRALFHDELPSLKGEIFMKLIDPRTGEVVMERHYENRITLDSSLLVAALLKDPDEPAHGVNMLAVGTGAPGDPPDAPPPEQRRLLNEIDRKTFSEITFRDADGNAVAIRTNVVDFTCIFSESEAVGPLNEMSLMSTISDNRTILNPNPNNAGLGGQPYDPTIDTSQYDLILNYFTFSVINKPNNMVFTLTWRITT